MRGLPQIVGTASLLLFCLGAVAPVRADLTSGLVSYWSFDDSSDPARDYSISENSGVVYGATWTAGGKVGGALSFDGVDDWVKIPQTFPFHLSTDATLAFWMNKSDNAHRSIFWTRGDSSDGNRFNIYANYIGYSFGLDYATSSYHDIGRIGTFGSGEWVHITVARSGNTYLLYEDGELARTYVDAYPSLPTYRGSWGIGYRNGYMYKGLLDEICLYDRALSVSEISQLASGVQPVPLPSAVLLATLGLNVAWWRLKRRVP